MHFSKIRYFYKIGLGHFSRINNLAEADLENEYFLIYRTDIDVKELLKKVVLEITLILDPKKVISNGII